MHHNRGGLPLHQTSSIMKFNGWTNYATWRINLELIDDERWNEYLEEEHWDEDEGQLIKDDDDVLYELAEAMKEDVNEYLFCMEPKSPHESLIYDFASVFLEDVSWYEIAKHLLEEFKINQS